ncbi:MAG: polysaccharide pyruvyl transferase family protein, partial [Lachnospiraceae bacterium]
MKAAVITLHNVCNYGTQLQTYATQEKLKEYFDDVVFIDYRRPDTYGISLMNTFTKGNPIKIPAILPTLLYWKHLFGGFQKKYIKLTEKKYLCEEDFTQFEDCADVYFSGSDQVWNTGWNNGVLPPLYLSFAPDNKPKYAYASSFGQNVITQNEIEKSRNYIERFEKISVREKSGITILKEQYHYDNAVQILDPTLAMPPSFWRKVAPKNKIIEDYILIYNLNRSREFDRYAEELSKHTGYKLYRLCTRFDQVFRNGKSILMPGIFDFITLIDHAKLVLTDSFHATAFSMNLNTEPVCIYPANYSGRLSEFLDLLGEEQRHVIDYDDFDVLERHVDFDKVNKILMEERKKTDQFLMEIISNN